MNRFIRRFLFVVLFSISALFASSQSQFTRYDELPGIIKSYKPSYSDAMPSWAKLLYQDPVNFNEVSLAFKAYMDTHPGEKSAIIRYFKIWQRACEPYARHNGIIELPDMAAWYRNQYALQTASGHQAPYGKQEISAPASNAFWTFLGPKETYWLNESGSSTPPLSCPWQVNVYSFDVAASDNDILFLGTETGFVNKSTDNGLNWQFLGQNYSFGGGVTAVAIHPTDEDVVYVAAGNQVHKTSNGGTTWTPLLPTGSLFYADRLRIDPFDSQKIFAASSNGLYVSTNSGSAWTQKWPAQTWDVEINPNDNSQVYALTKTGSNFSVIVSTDGGQTFQPQSSFPNNIVESSGGLLAVTADNPNMVLAILLSANNTPYLVKGTVSGSSWNWTLIATGQTGAFPMNNGQGFFDLVLDISPNDEDLILVGTTTLFKSQNGGTSFTAVGGYSGSFSIHPDIQDIRMLPNGETWVSTDGGMNYTTDNFTQQANWFARVNGIIGSDMWGFDQAWNEDIVVGGRYHNGNTAISDLYQPKALRMGGAESPTGWVLQGKSRHVAFNDLGNGWILPETAEGEPEGRFIFSKYPNMDEYGGRRSNLVHHTNYYGTLFLGEGTGFWKSTDAGVTWNLLYNFPARVRYLQISYSNPEVIYADIIGAGLVKSTDGGASWVQKPSLTAPPYGSSNWKGKLFLAISPYDENSLYACLQNGTWSADTGKVFYSTDGGDTWEDLTGGLSEYMKCLIVQPTSAGEDLVYLFTNAINGKSAKVYYRTTGMSGWELFNDSYPAGMNVNLSLPFFKDAKLRVGGNGSVWESPMQDTAFIPIINPWIEKAFYNCMLDTLYFDDHSILKHQGASWQWSIFPAPVWIEDATWRNPKVVLGNPGSYDVTLTVTQNGQTYTKSIPGMVTASTCPSLYDCNNPAELPKDEWSLIYVDSEELNYPGLAIMSFDDKPETIWHTRWSTGNDPYPHEIQVDLGARYRIYTFTYLPRQDGTNGRISEYRLYISEDTLNWGAPASMGQFENSGAPKIITLDTPSVGRYFRLVALSEVNGNPWASAAEFSMVGCYEWPVEVNPPSIEQGITAFPVPTDGIVNLSLPMAECFQYQILSSAGSLVGKGIIDHPSDYQKFDLGNQPAGIYLIRLTTNSGVTFNVKVVKY
ncbi:MAG: discoidin domain-containing protein [Bacteroidales bacterium]|nr:discoidin domain-containing protein [Bacteroidales bacterium]